MPLNGKEMSGQIEGTYYLGRRCWSYARREFLRLTFNYTKWMTGTVLLHFSQTPTLAHRMVPLISRVVPLKWRDLPCFLLPWCPLLWRNAASKKRLMRERNERQQTAVSWWQSDKRRETASNLDVSSPALEWTSVCTFKTYFKSHSPGHLWWVETVPRWPAGSFYKQGKKGWGFFPPL